MQQDQELSPHRESIVYRKDDPARHSNPREPTGKVGQRPLSHQPSSSTGGLGILALNKARRGYYKSAFETPAESIRRCLIRGPRILVTNGDNPDVGTATSRMVLLVTGHHLPQHNRSGICGLLRRGQGPGLGQAIPTGAPATEYRPPTLEYQPYWHAIDGLGGSSELVENNEVHEEELPYRASVPLSLPAGTTRVAHDPLHPWEGEPSGSSSETTPNDSNQQLEDDIDWDELIRYFEGETWWN